MRTLEEEIYNFMLPYLSYSGKPIETITEYKRYNMELIESHRHLILDFINRFFNIRKGLIRIDELLCDKKFYLWTGLNSMDDLETINMLVGLLIAVGLVEDSIIIRYESIRSMHKYSEFLLKEKFCLDDEETIRNYLLTLKDYVLPKYRFNVNSNVYDYMKNKLPGGTYNHQIKLKLLAWIKNSSLKLTDNDLDIINDFLDNNLEGFLNVVVIGFNVEGGADSLINALRSDPSFDYFATINCMVSRYTEQQREDLKNKKKIFLESIKLAEDKKRKLQ